MNYFMGTVKSAAKSLLPQHLDSEDDPALGEDVKDASLEARHGIRFV